MEAYEEEMPEIEPLDLPKVGVADIPSLRDLETSNFSRSNIALRRKKLVEGVLAD